MKDFWEKFVVVCVVFGLVCWSFYHGKEEGELIALIKVKDTWNRENPPIIVNRYGHPICSKTDQIEDCVCAVKK